jgi:integrase
MDRTEYRLARPVINGKPSSFWYVVWRQGGRERRRSTGQADRYAAEGWLAKFLAAKNAPPDTVDVNWILDRYEEDRKDRKSASQIHFNLRGVRADFGPSDPGSIDPDHVLRVADAWRSDGLSDGTIRTRLLLLRAALNWAVKMKYIDGLAPYIPAPPAGKPRDRHLTRDEFKRLYMAAEEPHIKTFLALGVFSGLRAGAILSLTWDQIDTQRMFIRPEGGSANKKRASVPINPPLALALGVAKWLHNGPYVVQWKGQQIKSVKKGFHRTVERAGIEPVRIHDLRRTCAIWQAEAGVPIHEIAEFLGDSIKIAERHYLRYSPDYLNRGADALSDWS